MIWKSFYSVSIPSTQDVNVLSVYFSGVYSLLNSSLISRDLRHSFFSKEKLCFVDLFHRSAWVICTQLKRWHEFNIFRRDFRARNLNYLCFFVKFHKLIFLSQFFATKINILVVNNNIFGTFLRWLEFPHTQVVLTSHIVAKRRIIIFLQIREFLHRLEDIICANFLSQLETLVNNITLMLI